ncbi:hypothetical protein O181_008338 [Austropuccinia psidii MF-1]|uniref:Integrase catalytic domain-containing protein n=1 Tax=Austropuccinia psidii MF-1 TaxID=1389203 RepID=A0A9Q3GIE7_9BASI|nr:hypothetical protein [Austropuccinia psidii MF-1]
MEIKNKLDITPAYFHTDRGGEFNSQSLVNFLTRQGIYLERGPPELPQTNGVAERFNQTLLSKMRCLLGQSNVPVSYWDEATAHASLLLSLLLHKHLKMKTPISVLNKKDLLIKPKVYLKRLIPFGMKVIVEISNPSSRRETGKIRVSRDYTLSACNPNLSMNQPASVLPEVSSLRIKLQVPSSKPEELLTLLPVVQPPSQSFDLEHSSRPAHLPAATESTRNYEYVPYYKDAPRNISSSINEENILTGRKKSQYRENLLLADLVPYSKAVSNPIEGPEWKKAMDSEYKSLTADNTGELVPYPTKPTKVIGSMWRLSCKRNEHGEVY